MTEDEFRAAIVNEAKTWLLTPYKSTGRMRGVGANCAQLLYGIAKGAGALPPDAPEPRWYSSQLHAHRREERLVEYVKAYGGREIAEAEVGPGDVILYKSGASHGHAAVIVEWPRRMIHTLPIIGCCYGHCTKEGRIAQMGRRYFTLWKG